MLGLITVEQTTALINAVSEATAPHPDPWYRILVMIAAPIAIIAGVLFQALRIIRRQPSKSEKTNVN